MMRRSWRDRGKQVIIIGILPILLLAALSLFIVNQKKDTASCEATDVAQRPIVNSTIAVHVLWSKAIEISNYAKSTYLVNTGSLLIGAHYCPDPWLNRVTAFAWQTGQVIWTSN